MSLFGAVGCGLNHTPHHLIFFIMYFSRLAFLCRYLNLPLVIFRKTRAFPIVI